MTVDWNTALLGLLNLFSLALLLAAIKLGSMYGRDSNRLTVVEQRIERIDANVTTILGNGHPGPFVPRELFDPLTDEVGRQRGRIHELANGQHVLANRVTVVETEVAALKEG